MPPLDDKEASTAATASSSLCASAASGVTIVGQVGSAAADLQVHPSELSTCASVSVWEPERGLRLRTFDGLPSACVALHLSRAGAVHVGCFDGGVYGASALDVLLNHHREVRITRATLSLLPDALALTRARLSAHLFCFCVAGRRDTH